MLDARTRDDLIEAVVATSRREIMPRFRRLMPSEIATKAGPHDLVTEADLRAEMDLGDAFSRILPEAAILGEEAVSKDPRLLDVIGRSDLSIIIDPIDGTANFAAGLALFGLIVALVAKGETVFGLLFDPVLEDWVFAQRGEGAWLARESGPPVRLMASSVERMSMSSGLVPLNACEPSRRAPVLAQFESCCQIQDLRCSCHDYRLLASGEADFMVSVSLNPWDHAAGQLVIAEAGGWSRVEGNKPYSPLMRQGRMVAAGTARLGQAVSESFLVRK